MRVLAAAAIIALLTSPAHSEDTPQQRAQKQQKQDLENAYQKALKNTRSDAPTTKADPWGNIRGPDPGQARQNSQSK